MKTQDLFKANNKALSDKFIPRNEPKLETSKVYNSDFDKPLKTMKKEIWKIIEGFEDYEVSNLGNVKSLKFGKERILKPRLEAKGYYYITLRNGIQKSKKIHQLVAEAFLNHKPCGYKLVVNHIDFNKINNNVENLEIVTARENSNHKHLSSSSQFTGVSWHKRNKKWTAQIWINGKLKFLGLFTCELEASNAYQKELLTV